MKTRMIALGVGIALAVCFALAAYAEPQGRMHRAIANLEQAKDNLQDSTGDKGGHRVRAIRLINDAIAEVKAGIAYDNTHTTKKEMRKGKR